MKFTVIDPICGMEVVAEEAVEKRLDGDQVAYFCSSSCARQFDTRRPPARPSRQGPRRLPPNRVQESIGRSSLTFDAVTRALRKRDFGVLTTVGDDGRPDSVAVNYGVSVAGAPFGIYVMTRRHLKKARNILSSPGVSFLVPLTRRVLWFLPPPSIRFQGHAEILDWTDEGGIRTFQSFFIGRQILKKYEEASRRGETRVCFLKITPDHEVSTYMVGYPLWEMSKRMESGTMKVTVPQLVAQG